MTHYTARAHTNIALLKYWGKADTTLMLPTTTSISLTLDEFYTDTTVWFDADLVADDVMLDDAVMTGKGYDKVTRFLDLVREMAGETHYAHVHSSNHVPTAAGLASSAAALAGAASRAAGLTLSPAELSRLARLGSGSASRSIFGGFAQWDRGHDDLTSVAKPLVETIDWPIQLLTVIIDGRPKKIDSRGGMQHAKATSPFYDDWVNRSNALVPVMQTAIANHDIDQIGQLAEANALQMHATNATAQPAFNYLTDSSWQVINLATTLRERGISVYATMDAGPNVKLISRPADTEVITAALAEAIPGVVVRTATPGPSIKIVEGDQI